MLALAQSKEVVEVAAKSGLTILETSLLGAFAILCLAVAVVAVWQLIRVQNKRVCDQQKLNDHMEKARERMEGLIEKMTAAFAGHKAALEQLSRTEQQQTDSLKQVGEGLTKVQTTLDSVIRDAVRGRPRSSSPPRGTPR